MFGPPSDTQKSSPNPLAVLCSQFPQSSVSVLTSSNGSEALALWFLSLSDVGRGAHTTYTPPRSLHRRPSGTVLLLQLWQVQSQVC